MPDGVAGRLAAPRVTSTIWLRFTYVYGAPVRLMTTRARYALELWPAATLTLSPPGYDVASFYRGMGWGYN
eukprot:SAG25_NODE_4946_length_726_cov_1.172249_1_plen_71_part_00